MAILDWSKTSKSIVAAAAVNPTELTMTDGKTADRLPALNASAGFFDTVGIHPVVGRGFRPEEDRSKAPGRVVITDGLWRRRFAQNRNIVGRAITLNGQPFTIVGVMPPSFRVPFVQLDMIIPLGRTADVHRGNHTGESIARLKPGVSAEQANAEFAAIGRSLARAYPDTNSGWSLFAIPLQTYFTKDTKPVMITLFAAVGLVLLIACANLAGLMLVRATSRRRENAVRIALGAGPAAIIRESLYETFLIAAIGGGTGILGAWWSLGPLLSLVPESVTLPLYIHRSSRPFLHIADHRLCKRIVQHRSHHALHQDRPE